MSPRSCLPLAQFLVLMVLVTAIPPPTKRIYKPRSNIVFQDSAAPPQPQEGGLTAVKPIVERGLIELCLGLERASPSLDRGENSVIAPLSVAGLAALLLAGASGATRSELQALFGIQHVPHREEELHAVLGALFSTLEGSKHELNKLSIGSGLFVQAGQEVREEYLALARGVYRSDLVPVDFRGDSANATALINQWISNRTGGMISKLLEQPVESTTSMLIANAIFFKGLWEAPFLEKYTKIDKFYVSKSEVIPVSLMVAPFENTYYSEDRDSHQAVGLPYVGGDTVMFFVLPKGDLKSFIRRLTVEQVRAIVHNSTLAKTVVALPRMRLDSTMELSGPLSLLGVKSLFSPRDADLSRMGKGFHVSELVHRVTIDVTEKGTEAAAVSVGFINRDGGMPVFRADRPFLFFIYNRPTGSVLFWGTVFRPDPLPQRRPNFQLPNFLQRIN